MSAWARGTAPYAWSTVSCMVSSFRFGGGWGLGPAGRTHASAGPPSHFPSLREAAGPGRAAPAAGRRAPHLPPRPPGPPRAHPVPPRDPPPSPRTATTCSASARPPRAYTVSTLGDGPAGGDRGPRPCSRPASVLPRAAMQAADTVPAGELPRLAKAGREVRVAAARPARCGMFTGQPGGRDADAYFQLRGYAYAHTRQLADLAATSWRCLRLRRDQTYRRMPGP